MSAVIREHDVTVLLGQASEQLATLPAASVNCVVTSPPYFGLRDYGVAGQIGLEETPAEYVESLRQVFAEVWRVLADDGVLWLNLGDTYYSGRGNHGGFDPKQPARRGFTKVRSVDKGGVEWARPKNLLGIPWRVAFALQDDGWNLRNDIIWNKPNAMPESVADRLSGRHEYLFLFAKQRRYRFDLDAIREPIVYADCRGARDEVIAGDQVNYAPGQTPQTGRARTGNRHKYVGSELGKNPGDVWTISTRPFAGAHFATMPPELVKRCLLAGCPDDGTVLDPFTGSGTTAMVARSLDLKFVGSELNPDYIPIIRQRIGQTPFEFEALA